MPRRLPTFPRVILKQLPHIVALVILCAAGYFLWHDFAGLDTSSIVRRLQSLNHASLALAVFLTFLNFFILTFYDVLALRHVGYKLAYPKIALTSFIAYVFAGNLGVSFLTAGAVRYRFYSRWGVSALHITHVLVFSAITLGLGLFAVGGLMLLFAHDNIFPFLPVATIWLNLGGGLLVACVLVYLVLCHIYHKPFSFKGLILSLPPVKLSLAQIGISGLDWLISATVLFVLVKGSLPPSDLSMHTFFLAFMVAQIAGVNSHVPGGIGVFDSLILLLLKPYYPLEDILGILVVYRALYYLLPFSIALLLFTAFEVRSRFRSKKT